MPTNPTGSILLRRGPTADRIAFCPLPGEVIYDTDTETFYIGDGRTYGGVSVLERAFPTSTGSRGVMIKGLTTETFSYAPGNPDGSDYQFLVYSKANGQYDFSSITASGVAITNLTLSGNHGITVTRSDVSPFQTNPIITTSGVVQFDVDPVPFKTAVSLENVTNESKATMFTSPTFTGHATIEGQTLTGVTGTGKLVLDNAPTISGHATIEGQTLTGVTGTGNLVLSASPTLTGTLTSPAISVTNNTTSSSTSTGALVVTGGVGIGGTTFIGGNLQVTGNISYNGGVDQLSGTQLNITDPMVYLAYDNVADTMDTGVLTAYNDGTHKHAGIVRDHSDNTWKFFTGLITEPGNTVAWADVTYSNVKLGTLTATNGVTLTGGKFNGALANTLTLNGIVYDGSSAVSISIAKGDKGDQGIQGPSTYDHANFVNGKPLANEVLMRTVAVRSYTLSANFAGCLAYCTTGPTSTQTINILKNGTTIGTITFAIASTSGVFAGSVSGVTMNIGDQLQVQMASGASQDASFSDLTFTFKGTSTS